MKVKFNRYDNIHISWLEDIFQMTFVSFKVLEYLLGQVIACITHENIQRERERAKNGASRKTILFIGAISQPSNVVDIYLFEFDCVHFLWFSYWGNHHGHQILYHFDHCRMTKQTKLHSQMPKETHTQKNTQLELLTVFLIPATAGIKWLLFLFYHLFVLPNIGPDFKRKKKKKKDNKKKPSPNCPL